MRKWAADPELTTIVNGYTLKRPYRFQSLAAERGYYLAILLANKKPTWSGVVILATSECIDYIMFDLPQAIKLDMDAVNPRKVAHDAMEYAQTYFDEGLVILDKKTKGRRPWYLERLDRPR